MISNRNRYVKHRSYEQLSLMSPDFDTDCLHCPERGEWGSVWNLIALSNPLNVKVHSVYPSIDGTNSLYYKTLNTTFKPNMVDPEKHSVTILWTNTTNPETRNVFKKRRLEWSPNHFVPLIESKHTIPILASRMVNPVFLSPVSCRSLEAEDLIEPEPEIDLTNSQDKNDLMPDLEHIKTPKNQNFMPEIDIIRSPHEHDFIPNLSTIIEESFKSINSNTYDKSNRSNDSRTTDLNENDTTESSEIEFIHGPLKKFMDITTTLQILSGPHTPLEEIPTGRKDGMYFVMDNSLNITKRDNGKRSEFWDDCGAWVGGVTPCSHYIERSGELITIHKRHGLYCVIKQQNNKREFIPLEPQPDEDSIMRVHRFYQQLKASLSGPDQFKKRVTWVEKSLRMRPDIKLALR